MTEEEAVHLSNISEAAPLVSSAIQNQLLPSDDNVRLLSDVVRGLPSLVVQDLSYVGVRFLFLKAIFHSSFISVVLH